ncbi:DUF1674 domain-containing protein [Bartonella krasnovii]|uniref:DUF1674 domain-containing protein n=1 Tax=Bartonella krasnovii TaxID=2267275 RepID=A0A5B9D3J3_9HYPH|nr:DUF1674 domain-containing protein [Bartonella krasnovii]QEE12930.1 DUF1674 domain-containing protein [Bartonella krasnovii]UNF29048.1 DUF1674 domain-containing protein [Bartonella krasnovii]UNF35405.1 DUF1674 domain-containing protein [Bartonella krasnovii]UNF37020.1 DUF1674 domain-containing protein [Bartonella krasnovii]UNF38721.1 DUF1674 domain-containing protein [Bartonella krasnovii]
MNKKDEKTSPKNSTAVQQQSLPSAAQRALKEAEERRKDEAKKEQPLENGGRGGKDPSRYGDWEIKGRAIDF